MLQLGSRQVDRSRGPCDYATLEHDSCLDEMLRIQGGQFCELWPRAYILRTGCKPKYEPESKCAAWATATNCASNEELQLSAMPAGATSRGKFVGWWRGTVPHDPTRKVALNNSKRIRVAMKRETRF